MFVVLTRSPPTRASPLFTSCAFLQYGLDVAINVTAKTADVTSPESECECPCELDKYHNDQTSSWVLLNNGNVDLEDQVNQGDLFWDVPIDPSKGAFEQRAAGLRLRRGLFAILFPAIFAPISFCISCCIRACCCNYKDDPSFGYRLGKSNGVIASPGQVRSPTGGSQLAPVRQVSESTSRRMDRATAQEYDPYA